AVRGRRTHERLGDVHRIVAGCRVELRQRGQPRILTRREQLIPVKAADRGDPCTSRDRPGTGGNEFLHVGNRRSVLERHVIAGTIPHEHDVVVVVDDAGYDRASSEVDHAGSRTRRRRRTIDGGETTVPDRHGGGNRVLAVHRVNLAVHEDELLVRLTGSSV